MPAGTLGLCPACGGILRPEYPDEAVSQLRWIAPGPGLDRYRALLPVSRPLPSLGEGDTPLIPLTAHRRPRLGLKNLYFKNEGLNPSGAFKDRSAALGAAWRWKPAPAACSPPPPATPPRRSRPTAPPPGLPCLILLEPGNPPTKLRQAVATGARVLPVKGSSRMGRHELHKLLQAVAARLNYYLAFIWAPVNPYLLEGLKTISYEVAARLPGAPDVLVTPRRRRRYAHRAVARLPGIAARRGDPANCRALSACSP